MTIRGILFDKDGTLLDFEATWGPLYRELALDIAGDDPERARQLLTAGGLDPVSGRITAGSVLGAGTTFDIVRAWFPDLGDEAFAAMVARIDAAFYAHGHTASVPVPELVETLDILAGAGYALGVATSDGTAAARIALAAVGADRRIGHVFGYDSVAHPKPGPDMVHAFASITGLGPREIAVVGDNRHDLQMARSAGAGAAIGVLTGNSAADDLAPLADVVLPSIRDLPAWLQNRK